MVRSKSYRGGHGADECEILYLRYRRVEFIFKAAEIVHKFRFKPVRDDCANTLRYVKFRLPRRINFIFLGRLNLKCVLLWRKFKARYLELDRVPRNFKIYRASSIRRVNLYIAFTA